MTYTIQAYQPSGTWLDVESCHNIYVAAECLAWHRRKSHASRNSYRIARNGKPVKG